MTINDFIVTGSISKWNAAQSQKTARRPPERPKSLVLKCLVEQGEP
jgi:hypothetical protein